MSFPDRAATPREPYVRSRENPFFEGLLRTDMDSDYKISRFGIEVTENGRSISRSTSDIGQIRRMKLIPNTSIDVPSEDSLPLAATEPLSLTLSEQWTKLAKSNNFSFSLHSDVSLEMVDVNDSAESSPQAKKALEILTSLSTPARHVPEKSYSIQNVKPSELKIPLPQSAASFYNGYSPRLEIVESCEGIQRLNLFLKERRDDVSGGVPGRFLHVVIGQDAIDVGTFASTITYAFYMNETLNSDEFCTVPVINMKRMDLNSHAELKWLLSSCGIDEANLIFIDEIDLSYYDLYGSLKIVLINGCKISNKQEALKEAVVEIFSCKKGDFIYPWTKSVTLGEDYSCCTLIAEKFANNSPELLAGQGFSRLLLSGILLDTGNLTHPNCTSKDMYMVTLLILGAGRFGCDGLYQILRYKMYDVSDLKVIDILRKDFKKWNRVGNRDNIGLRFAMTHIGMSSIGIPIGQLLSHDHASIQEIKVFQQLEKLRVLMIVSGYYDAETNFKREILVYAESVELMQNLMHFINSNATQLPLKVLQQPGLRDEIRAFEVDKFTSRKTIERLLEEFASTY